MLLSLQSLGNTISAHPWLTLVLFLLTSALVLRHFSEVELDEVFTGVLRLLRSIFDAPFHFIRSAMRAMAAFRTDDGTEAHSRTYLLHRSIEYSRLATLVGAILLVATGMTVAILGVWPSEQLQQRKSWKAILSTADSAHAADSLRLVELTSGEQAEIARRRQATQDSLRGRRTAIAGSVQQYWDEVGNTITPPDRWIERLDSAVTQLLAPPSADADGEGSVAPQVTVAAALIDRLQNSSAESGQAWDNYPAAYRYAEDSALVVSGSSVRKALTGLVKADTTWTVLQRGLLLAISVVETQHTYVNALRVGSTEQEIEAINARMSITDTERTTARQALKDIRWFAGVKFFFLTVLYTYLLFIAFVWVAGLAIETTLLFVGIAQDIAALRRRSEP